MKLEEAENKLDTVDSILSKSKRIIWKHKWFLLFILFSYCVYWAFSQDEELVDDIEYYEQGN